MKIKDLPVSEMPRERLMLYGTENLSNADLLSIILRNGVKDISAKDIANNILNTVGNIHNLNEIGVRELSKIKGVGSVKAMTLLASIELGKRVIANETIINMPLTNDLLVHDTFKKHFINLKQEKFIAIFLDNKKRLISYKTLFIGTINKAIIHPRDIFNEAIKKSAVAIIVMHNHPSGSIYPSEEDMDITKKIIEVGKIVGIPLIDHLITNGEEYFSFYEEYKEYF